MTQKYLVHFVLGLLFAVPFVLFAAEDSFVGPGGCTERDECKTYCDTDSHKEECLNFAEQNGMMSGEEVEQARKFLNQTGPGGCRGEECRTYCEDPAHQEECITFGLEHGFIKEEDVERFKKFREIEERGGGPGGCKGEECRTYCADSAHEDECFEFAKNNGLIKPEEEKHYEAGRKIRQKIETGEAPGGCSSEEGCRSYCSDISHVEECVKFGAAHTGMSEAEVRLMLQEFKEGKSEFERGPRFDRGPEDSEFRGRPSPGEGERDYGERFKDGEQFNSTQKQFSGPGGCSNEEECRSYCSQNPEECSKFSPPNEQYMQGEQRMHPENISPESMPYNQNMPMPENMQPGQYPKNEQNYQQNMQLPEGMMQPPAGMMQVSPENIPTYGSTPPPEGMPSSYGTIPPPENIQLPPPPLPEGTGTYLPFYQPLPLANVLGSFFHFFGLR